MTAVSLQDFQNLTGLSDAALLGLLKDGRLPCTLSEERGLVIDMSKVSVRDTVTQIVHHLAAPSPDSAAVLKEELHRLLSRFLGEVIEEALQRLAVSQHHASSRGGELPAEDAEA